MEKVSKKVIFIALILVVTALGISYSFFNYYRLSEKQYEVITGKIFLNFVDGSNTLSLTNVFPETREEALKKTNNVLNFSIEGRNTTEDKDLYFEIMLNEGNDIEGRKRLKPLDLRFDLVETTSGKRVTLFEDMGYNDFNGKRIWVDTVLHGNETNISKSYELRMWISDDVIISDTESYADYKTDDFKNSFANVKVSVYGDFIEKSVPYNYMKKLSNYAARFWDTDMEALASSITSASFISLPKEEITNKVNNASIVRDMSDTSKSKSGSVMMWLEEDEVVNDKQYYKMYIASDGITFFYKNLSGLFDNFTSLKEVSFENIDTRYVSDMLNMFRNCRSLTTIDISNWDVSSVKNMSYMFSNCNNLTSLNIGGWDVSGVSNMSDMFYNCSNLTSLNIGGWDVSGVSNMSYMFSNCNSLTTLDVSNWDVSSVSNMSSMFYKCSSLTTLDVSKWDVSGVSGVSSMFSDCSGLTTLDVSKWDVSNVSNMSSMFYKCSSLTTLDVSKWNVSNVSNMSSMFYKCSSLTTLDVSKWDVSGVSGVSSMFRDCSGLTTLDVSKWNISGITSMDNLFYNCTNLVYLDLSNWDVSDVTSMQYVFYGCTNLVSVDLSGWNVSSVKYMHLMFSDCSNLTTIYADSNWQEVATNLTSTNGLFAQCYKLVGKVAYNQSYEAIAMANPDTGYFTRKDT